MGWGRRRRRWWRLFSEAEAWGFGLPVCRSTGLPVCRSAGLLVCRSTGLPVYRSSERVFGSGGFLRALMALGALQPGCVVVLDDGGWDDRVAFVPGPGLMPWGARRVGHCGQPDAGAGAGLVGDLVQDVWFPCVRRGVRSRLRRRGRWAGGWDGYGLHYADLDEVVLVRGEAAVELAAGDAADGRRRRHERLLPQFGFF